VRTGAHDIELLVSPSCPNAAAARAVLAECLDRLSLSIPVRERVGEYPSPTILVDGIDVMTGARGAPRLQACRLDVPTTARVLAALTGRPFVPHSSPGLDRSHDRDASS
jgi:hypothetical protein